ncbi:acetyl-CoA synthetase-like protein [Martensiomyces pterosporus]|nr:acetyl-CoA synthetase-like protein [Martensiomyces pterosporus]
MRSYQVPHSSQPGYSPVLRHPDYKDGRFTDAAQEATTVYELLERMVRLYPDVPFLGARQFDPKMQTFGEYAWKTARDTATLVDDFGSGLDWVFSKHVPSASKFEQQPLGIYSINRPEWLLTEFSGFRSRRYSIALYDTLGVESVEYTINHAEIAVIVCSIDKIPKLLQIRDRLPGLKVIISMDSFEDHGKSPLALKFTINSVQVLRQWAEAKGVALYDIPQVVGMGCANRTAPTKPSASDLSTICYTSGTTGNPKGVMLTHANSVYSAKCMYHHSPVSDTTYLSFLPLAHSFDRSMIYSGMIGGIHVGFYSGDIQRILEDAQVLRPTVMVGVPRLLNRIYDRISAATIHAPGLSGVIARTAIGQKLKKLDTGGGVKHALWDRVICNKIALAFGGRLELLCSGSAPLDSKVLNFLRVAIGCTIIEGYGLTESYAAGTSHIHRENTGAHIGVPVPGIEIRLRDVPEMSYLTTDKPCPRGELLVRGGSVFKGYYKNEEKSKEALDDGWLITGDIAQINEEGNIRIIDRRKNIFKLSQGEYVAPEYLETVYSRHPLVLNILVHGDTLKSELVAVVVPDPETFIPWAAKITGNASTPMEQLVKNEQVVGALLAELRSHGSESRLHGFEIIRSLYCDSTPFDIEGNGLLTSTLKLKRDTATAYYRETIDALYSQIEASK